MHPTTIHNLLGNIIQLYAAIISSYEDQIKQVLQSNKQLQAEVENLRQQLSAWSPSE